MSQKNISTLGCPVHQIFQGNCGGPTLPEVLDWYKIKFGEDNCDFVGSQDEAAFNSWHKQA